MCSHCIYISFPKKCIDQLPVSETDQISQFRDPLICPVQKNAFRLGCRLDCKILSLQVTQFINVTARIYSNHLTACYVRSGPAVIVKTSLHGKAAHNTVNLPALHQFLFLFPVDLDNLHLVPHSLEGFGRQLYIDSCRNTIFIQIVVWRIAVAAERDNRPFLFLPTDSRISAPCQNARRNTCKQNACNHYFSFHHKTAQDTPTS